MKTIRKAAVVLLFIFPFFSISALYAIDYFDVSKPTIKKAAIYITTDSDSDLNQQFVSQLKNMLAASLLFENTNTKRDADYSISIGNSVESKDLLITIAGEKQSAYKTKFFGIRFRSVDDEYLDRKTAQMANRIIEEFFGIEGSVGSSISWSVTEGRRKTIYMRSFAIDDSDRQITYNFFSNYGASWNHSLDHIVYTSHTDFGTVINIQQVEPLVFKAMEVFKQSGAASSPVWAPDNTIYLTLHVSDQNSDIFQFRLEGELNVEKPPKLIRVKQVTYNPSIDTEPALSPDNTKMAYVSDQTSEPQIYILDLTTQKSERITRQGGYNSSPSWSPNGKYIAYKSIRNKKSYIYRIELSTGSEKQLTPVEIDAEDPTWSPDGSMIAFTGKIDNNGSSKIFYMLSSGGNYNRLTDTEADVVETSPSWGPALH